MTFVIIRQSRHVKESNFGQEMSQSHTTDQFMAP